MEKVIDARNKLVSGMPEMSWSCDDRDICAYMNSMTYYLLMAGFCTLGQEIWKKRNVDGN